MSPIIVASIVSIIPNITKLYLDQSKLLTIKDR